MQTLSLVRAFFIIWKRMKKYTFSGHESFQCKSLWLKKGYDFVKEGKSFNESDAVVSLGVGKNMVSSIRYWLKAFNITDESDSTTAFGRFIFDDNGADPFIEDTSTLWLLHYYLIKKAHATLYFLLFSSFHKTRNEFSKLQLLNFIKQENFKEKFKGFVFNENTIGKDIDTLLKNYVEPYNKNNYEDFSTLLLPLNLIRKIDKETYAFNYQTKEEVPPLVFLYAIKDMCGDNKVIEFEKIVEISRFFCLSTNELYSIFSKLHTLHPEISFDNTAGEQLFTMNDNLSKEAVLRQIYF